jgi:hypothetical protein
LRAIGAKGLARRVSFRRRWKRAKAAASAKGSRFVVAQRQGPLNNPPPRTGILPIAAAAGAAKPGLRISAIRLGATQAFD